MLDQNKIEKLKALEENLLPFSFQKKEIIRLLLITLIIKGHVLIEDLPGVGKTTLARAFAQILGRTFSRIQGTSDTLPQDIIGGEVINIKTKEFSLKKGPIFSEIVLIDEINRMHPKSQSAFLQAMEEGLIAISGTDLKLSEVHLVLATQNPIEYAGTYLLPEAQRDRFSCTLTLGYPSKEIQKSILKNQDYLELNNKISDINPIVTLEDILYFQETVTSVTISDEILSRIIDFAEWTRDPNTFIYGVSPRGLSILSSAMRANAFLEGRDFVIPEDGLHIIVPFLVHRIELHDELITRAQLSEMLLKKYHELFKSL